MKDLDPNLVAGLVTLIGAFGTWLWRKARGEKQLDLSELLDEAITAEVVDAIDDRDTLESIHGRLERAAAKLGTKLGVKLPSGIVRLAIAWGEVEFRKLAKAREAQQVAARELPAKLEAMAEAAEKVAGAFEAKGAIPKLDITVERIP